MSTIFASQRNAFAASAAGLRVPANGLNNNNANNNPRIDGWAGV
jgi:hypothetical protein